jgi:hypothetical protein
MAHTLEVTPFNVLKSDIKPARWLGRGFVTALAENIMIRNSRTFEFELLDGSSVTLVVRNAWKERQLIRLLEGRFKNHPTEPLNALINPPVNGRPIELNGTYYYDLKHENVMQVEPDENGVSKVFVGYTAYSIKLLEEGKYVMSRDDDVKPGPSYVDPKNYCQKLQKEISDYKLEWYVSKVPMPRYHPYAYVSSRREIWSTVFTKYLGRTLMTRTFQFKLSTGENMDIVLENAKANSRLAKSLGEAFEKNPAIIHYLTGDVEQSEGKIRYPYHSDTLQFVRNHGLSLNIVFEGKEYCVKPDIGYIFSADVKFWSDSRYFIVEVGHKPSSYEAKIRAWKNDHHPVHHPCPHPFGSDAYYEWLEDEKREEEERERRREAFLKYDEIRRLEREQEREAYLKRKEGRKLD